MKERATEQRQTSLTSFDYLQIWSLRFSAVVGGVVIPLLVYSASHPGILTEMEAQGLAELTLLPAFGIFSAEPVKNRLKAEGKIK